MLSPRPPAASIRKPADLTSSAGPRSIRTFRPMKTLTFSLLSLALWTAQSASAASLMLNFRSTSTNGAAAGNVAGSYLTLSPAHTEGWIPQSETSWNNFSTAASSSTLNLSNNTPATGVSITFGIETAVDSGIINYASTTGINTTALYGSGGGTNLQQPLAGNAGSIYGNGNNSANTAAARAGWIGGGTATAGTALGLRVDGLAAGDYRIYVMGSNTNSNFSALPMSIHTTAGASSSTFTFSSVTAEGISNPRFPSSNPTGYNTFIDGENYVAVDVTVADGESLFLAAAGNVSTETRGFLNMVQIVPIPEPSAALLAGVGLLALARRRR